MKKFTFSFKSLLVACGLLIGSANAWGGVTNIFSQDSWVHTHPGAGQNGDRSSSLSFTETSSIDDNWTASFDVTTSSTNSRTNGARNFQVALLSASATSFPSNALATSNVLLGANFITTSNTDYSSFPCTITVNDVAEAETVTLSHGTKYTFSVSVNGTSMTVSIKNGATSVFSKNVTLAAFVKPKGIYDLLPRPYNAGWGVYTNTYADISVTKEVTAEEVSTPSIGVSYNGANRTVTITSGVSSESNAVTTYYTTDGGDPTSSSSVYSAPFDVDADCTVKAITIANSTSVASTIASQGVTVGILKLATPTFAKTSYADGKYTVTMTSDQSGLAYPPVSTTLYYSIGGATPVAYSAPFEFEAGSSVSGYVSADKYDNSEEAALTSAVRPVLSEVWYIDFAGQASEDKGGVTVGETAFAANGVNFGNITSTGLTSNDNFGVKTGSSWLLRNSSRGLYSSNGSGTPVGIQGLKEGQYIKMVVSGMTGLSVSDAASLVDNMSTNTEKYIIADKDGNANINFDRYGYIKYIAVCDVVTTVPVTISAAGYATFSSTYALDLTTANTPSGLTAYYIDKDDLTAGNAPFTTINQTVAAGEGILLKGAAGTYDIKVAATGTALTDNALVATDGTAIADGNYVFAYETANPSTTAGFYYVSTATAPVAAGKAYLDGSKVPTGGGVKSFIPFDGTATGIEAPAIAEETEEDGILYNIAGQVVSKDYKGIVIKNGKKFINK